MGDVYLGTSRRGQQMAIKLIRGAQLDDDEFRARFRREVRAAAKVRSRFIANLIDADPDAELPWLATEYVPGPTLAQALAAQGPLPEAEVLRLVAGVAEALHEMHRAGLVHRDVKPANVILGPDGPRLIDLGVVGTIDATRLTLTGQPVGTPVYMAPEQASGSRATSAADVWALGALAYYAATGNRLFDGDHPAVVLYRVSAEEPAYDDCPTYLRPFLDACLVRDPDGRPSTDAILRSLGVPDPGAATLPVALLRTRAQVRARAQVGTHASGHMTGSAPRTPRPRRRVRIIAGAAVGAAVLAGTTFGVLDLLSGDDELGGGAPQTLPQTQTQTPSQTQTQTPTQTGAPPEDRPERVPSPVADGTQEQPWALGSEHKLDSASCWIASVDQVQGRLATLTLSCDQAGTSLYETPTPNRWLGVFAVGQDGTVRQSDRADATAQDTFWTQGNLPDPAAVTTTVTLPDVGPLAAVLVEHKNGYGSYWAVTP